MKKTAAKLLVILLLGFTPFLSWAYSIQQDQSVTLPKGRYQLDVIIKVLEKVPDLNVSFNPGHVDLKRIIKIEQENPSIKELIRAISEQSNCEVLFNDNYLVIREKKNVEISLKAKVLDKASGETIVGANVIFTAINKGGASNEKGEYITSIPVGMYQLSISFIGYETLEQQVVLSKDTVLVFLISPSTKELEEIRITAQRKFFGNMDYGREIPVIGSDAILRQNSSNASDLLHGRVAGVWSTKTSGAPGDQQKIRIRGQNSFFSSAEPLYVVDGVPVPVVNLTSLGIADLNVYDIDNITVLKDASSASLYGYQGGNGVILIDTKQATENAIQFSVKTGFQWFDNYYDLMDSKDFIESLELANANIKTPLIKYQPAYTDSLCSHNRQNEIFNRGALQEYQLSGSGVKKTIKYYLSGNYGKQTGILNGSEYQRITFNTRLSKTFGDKLIVDLSYRPSYQLNKNNQNEYNGNRLLFEGLSKAPCLECTPDSLIQKQFPNVGFNQRTLVPYDILRSSDLVPDSIIHQNDHDIKIKSHAASLSARYQINRNWNINLIESVMSRHNIFQNQSMNYQLHEYSPPYAYYELFSYYVKSTEEVRLYNHQINLSYNTTINLHEINVVAAHRFYIDNLWWKTDSLNGLLNKDYIIPNSMVSYGSEGSVIRKLDTYLLHFNYNYNQTYFLSLIGNVSRIREGLFTDYYTFFPSVSVNYNLANEPIMASLNCLNNFSLYSNYGKSGNYPLSGLANDIYTEASTYTNNQIGTYPVVSQLANHHLRHEATSEFDLGFKSGFFNNRLQFKGAYFKKKVGNMIIQRDIPLYYGDGKIYVNLGDIDVKGYELEFEATPIIGDKFTWTMMGNFTKSDQIVRDLVDGQSLIITQPYDILWPDFVIKEGGRIGDIYGNRFEGLWTSADDADPNKTYRNFHGMRWLNAKNVDEAVIINGQPKVVIGNSNPDFTWNLFNSFAYRNFSLDVVVYSVWGVDKFNATRAATFLTGVNRDLIPYYRDSMAIVQTKEFYESNLFVDDASFIRLKSITLGYTLNRKMMAKEIHLSLSVENLYTYTKYRGFDPETTIYTDNNFSDNAIDRGAYPNPKAIIFKIDIKL
ncbi:MAG: SusC/RagA family TonB-linked outer membrane protein [Prolixibacteraceae bacterium]